MQITIDNLDGRGPVPYEATDTGPITLHRRLNQPSLCGLEIVVERDTIVPVRHARVVVTAHDGTVMFTGYVATEPLRAYRSETTWGITYSARISAISDEWLLDKLGSGAGGAIGNKALRGGVLLPLNAQTLLTTLTTRVQAAGSAAIECGETVIGWRVQMAR